MRILNLKVGDVLTADHIKTIDDNFQELFDCVELLANNLKILVPYVTKEEYEAMTEEEKKSKIYRIVTIEE